MAKWLTQDWLDETRRLAQGQPERPGASARIQYVVTGGPEGEVQYFWILEDGRLSNSELGKLDDAEVKLTQTWDDAIAIQKGELDANAAFMQGRIKVVGDMGKLIALMPITSSAEYRTLQEQIAIITEF